MLHIGSNNINVEDFDINTIVDMVMNIAKNVQYLVLKT